MSLDVKNIPDVFDEIPIGIIIRNSAGCITYANKFAHAFAVNTIVQGQQLLSCFPFLAHIGTRKEICVDTKIAKKSYRFHVQKVTLANTDELITFTNETSQKILQHEIHDLQDKLELYENLLNSIDEGVLAVDKQGRILFMNKTQETIDNLDFKKVKGNPLVDHYSGHDSPDEKTSLLLKIIKTGNRLPHQPQYYLTSGRHSVNVITSCSPLLKKDELVGAVSTSQDFNVTADLVKHLKVEYNPIYTKKENQVISNRSTLNNGTRYSFDDIIGKSKLMCEAVMNAKRAARTSTTILIYGKTGTGKELFAQSIHNESHLKKQPFIAVNCSALPESLLESILFGTVKGAFTGAVDRAGIFEQANGGTLLLDEINSMPLYLQPKLLRVLQEGFSRRIGGTKEIKVTPRVICTINVTPQEAIDREQIRTDLYYRLAVVTIAVPSLKERATDIPILTDHFFNKYNIQLGMNVRHISTDAMDFFMSYSWPGNVRELENVIEGTMSILHKGETSISLEQLPKNLIGINLDKKEPSPSSEVIPGKTALPTTLREKERTEIIRTLQITSGNISQSARILGMSRQNLQYKIKRFNIPLERIRNNV